MIRTIAFPVCTEEILWNPHIDKKLQIIKDY